MSAAAQHLGVSYTTVSRRIHALQEGAGVRLVEKVGRRYTLTEAGQQAVQAAKEIEQHSQDLARQWFGHDARLVGSLRVTTLDLFGVFYAKAFGEFAARYPGIDVEIITDNRLANLTRRQADIAIRVTNKPPEHLVGRRISRFNYSIYGARSLLDKHAPDTPLAHYPWIDWDESQRAHVTNAWMQRHIPTATIAAKIDSSLVLLTLARAGVGLAFLPDEIASNFEELEVVQVAPEEFNIDVWLLTHEELRSAARIRVMMDHMAKASLSWI